MTGWPTPPGPAAHVQAAALRAAFPGYVVNVITRWGERPRFEVVARDASASPYCLISTDVREICRAARLTAPGAPRVPSAGWRARCTPGRPR